MESLRRVLMIVTALCLALAVPAGAAMAGTHLVTICGDAGAQTIRVDQNGTPVSDDACEQGHCAACLVHAAPPPTANLATARPTATALPRPVAPVQILHSATPRHCPARGPPSPQETL
ncbi:hypothetical protein [Paracoccus jeotgali]|uniref:hypothetical protein n=1 Tax=Paracoccus jeotgali TaxID=2065379 RepID=UPI0028ADE391|nr:hypothetical protein [Paracoccus jeotgali]